MTDCCVENMHDHRAAGLFGAREVTYADMVARAAYRAVMRVAEACEAWDRHRRTRQALDRLERLDDRHLADIGLSRQALTAHGLAMAAAERARVQAAMGR